MGPGDFNASYLGTASSLFLSKLEGKEGAGRRAGDGVGVKVGCIELPPRDLRLLSPGKGVTWGEQGA